MKSARILIVDDDDHVREALIDELSSDYRVEAVSSGGEAFDALSLHQYDVIISDLKMPDHDGIEVLEFARLHQQDPVRVLLTGYLDERAHHALLMPDAPYKVGKPWHDEIEVVVRRGLEQRELARRLCASVEDALRLTTFDGELAATRTPIELSEAIVRRALTADGVISCATVVRLDGGEHVFTGGIVSRDGPGWFLDLPLDMDGDLRLQARGATESARQLVSYMAYRAQRWCGLLEASGHRERHRDRVRRDRRRPRGRPRDHRLHVRAVRRRRRQRHRPGPRGRRLRHADARRQDHLPQGSGARRVLLGDDPRARARAGAAR